MFRTTWFAYPVLLLIVFHQQAAGADVDIDLNAVVHVISDEFVSYTINAHQMRTMSDQLEAVSADWQPAYVRIDSGNDVRDWTKHSENLVGISQLLR